MKTNFILLFFLAAGISLASGKGYTLTTHTAALSKVDSTSPDILQITVTNTTSNDLHVKWAMVSNSFSFTGWTYNFCDLNTCFLTPSTTPSSSTDLVDPNGQQAFSITVTHYNSLPSNASMTLVIWDITDTANRDTLTMSINATRLGVKNAILPDASLEIYPNPAQNYISIQSTSTDFSATHATVFNAEGALVSEYTMHTPGTQIPVADLAKGVYFIRIQDNAGREAMKRFVKE